MRYTVSAMAGRAGRMTPADRANPDSYRPENLCPGQRPRFGLWWFYWLPRARSNGGRFARRETVDYTANWLCFWLSVTFWPT